MASSTIDITAGQTYDNTGAVSVAPGDLLLLNAAPSATFLNTGTVTVDGGTLEMTAGEFVNSGTVIVENGGTVQIDPEAVTSGQGVIEVESGGVIAFGSAVGYAQTIEFLSAGTISLADPGGFNGLVTGFSSGDVLDFAANHVNWVLYANSATGGHVYYGSAGSDGKTSSIRLDGIPQGEQLGISSDNGGGGGVAQIVPVSVASGGDWYDGANWSPAGAPGMGGYAQINTGTVTISAADVAQYGPLAYVQVAIGGDGTLASLVATGETIADTTSVSTAGSLASVVLNGSSELDGAITARTNGAQLAITIGTADNAAVLTLGSLGVIDAGSETGVTISGGDLVNGGTLQSGGLMTVDAGTTIGGNGVIQIVSAGSLVLGGAVGSGQTIEMFTAGESLTIRDLSLFHARFGSIAPSDTIDIADRVIDDASYDRSTGVLTLHNQGTIVGTLDMVRGLDGSFDVSQAQTDALLVYRQPDVQGGVVVSAALPVPAVGTAGTTISLSDLLMQAFGSIPADYTSYGISFENAAFLDAQNLSYWDPANPSVTEWVDDGTIIPSGTTMPVSDISQVSLVLGNNIDAQAHLVVPVEYGAHGEVLQSIDYAITTVDSRVAQPDYLTEAPTVSGILAAAQSSQDAWGTPLNNNDCPNISNVIGAAAGAVHPVPSAATDPDQNVSGGFWRIIYQGTQVNPVTDWYQLVAPGDFVRMAWSGGGQHTTTIIGTVQSDGSLEVYDNDYPIDHALGISGIGFHSAEYWPGTNPSTITIYRLASDQRYLVTAPTPQPGATSGDIIQGSRYDNLIVPTGLADKIDLGPGNDEVQGTLQQVTNDTVHSWKPADLIDITDIAPDEAGTPQYDATTGTLTMTAGMATLQMQLPTGLVGRFFADSDGSGGTVVSEMPCFAAGTRLRTVRGEIFVEALAVGDRIVTASRREAPVVWLGHRRVDCTRHPDPARVWPVRVAAGAFGPDLPMRDVLLSPDHALFVEGVLVPVRCVVNGGSIMQVKVCTVTYFHIELDRHDIVLADGLPAESYLDTGNRSAFDDGAVVQLHAEFAPDADYLAWEALACAPLRVAGPEVERVRALLRERRVRRDGTQG